MQKKKSKRKRNRTCWNWKKKRDEKRALKALSSAQPLIPSLPTTSVDEQIVKREAPKEENEYVWKATNEATKVEDDPIRSNRPMEGIKMVAAQEPSTVKTEAPEESKDSVCRSWMGSRGEPGSCLLTSGTLTSGFGDISMQFSGFQHVPDHEANN
uniref:Uncharacterized protein n=1 Tax=Caenorhabditis tropicalis TaxID=1561998 RepID=A0A1I7UK64_9PELO